MGLYRIGINVYKELITTYPKYCLVFTVLITLVSGLVAKEIRIDNNFAALFATDNDEMAFRHLYRETFSADDNQLVAVLERKNISDATLVQILEDISNLVKSISGIERVQSATESSILWSDKIDIYVDTLFGSNIKTDKTFAERVDLLTNSNFGGNILASKDGQYFLVIGEMFATLNDLENPNTRIAISPKY